MSQHEKVSNDTARPGMAGAGGTGHGEGEESDKMNEHEAISSEAAEGTGEAAGRAEATDFEGGVGRLEEVEGFDAARVLNAGISAQEIAVTEALEALPAAGELEFVEPETVCGADNRVRISPATDIPWRWCCQLLLTMGNGSTARGTGWFIGPRTVMTAGHCVFSHGAGGWVRQIEVIPGMDGASRPFGSQIGTSFRSVTGWTVNANEEYDYGAIILPNNTLGNRVGYFGFAVLSDAALQNLLVNNAGYAGDKPFGTLWFNADRITQVTARRLHYMIDTFGGQSGSPIWRFQSNQRHGVGIHGYGGCPNKAVRITQAVFNNMLAWRNLGF